MTLSAKGPYTTGAAPGIGFRGNSKTSLPKTKTLCRMSLSLTFGVYSECIHKNAFPWYRGQTKFFIKIQRSMSCFFFLTYSQCMSLYGYIVAYVGSLPLYVRWENLPNIYLWRKAHTNNENFGKYKAKICKLVLTPRYPQGWHIIGTCPEWALETSINLQNGVQKPQKLEKTVSERRKNSKNVGICMCIYIYLFYYDCCLCPSHEDL